MVTETLKPARPTAPGRIILRELEARGWSQQDLALIINRPVQMVNEIINAKKQITAETARQLASAFGTSPDLWINLEMQYQLFLSKKEREESEISRRSRLFELAPLNEMRKRGWIRSCGSLDELEAEVCRFLRIPSIDVVPEAAASFRLSQERNPHERAKIAWARRVEHLAEAQPAGTFRPENLPKTVEMLLRISQRVEEIALIPNLLRENGIRFVIVPHLSKTYLDGAALWVDGNPVVALSLRYHRIDSFWFTLLHELAHISLHQKRGYLDENCGQVSQEPQEDDETQANRQAASWLIDQSALDAFIARSTRRYSRRRVEEFAALHNRHPGIVVGQLMYRQEIKYNILREYLVDVRPYLETWVDVPYPAPA